MEDATVLFNKHAWHKYAETQGNGKTMNFHFQSMLLIQGSTQGRELQVNVVLVTFVISLLGGRDRCV